MAVASGYYPESWSSLAGRALAAAADGLALPSLVRASGAPAAAPIEVVGDTDWPEIYATLGGDGEAYASLVRKYQQVIAAQMWKFCRHRPTCEELTHEVFVEAYLSLKRFRGDAPLVHWLRKIATRVGYRYFKRQADRRAEGTIAIEEWDQAASHTDAGASAPSEAAEAAGVVHAMLAKLPARDRLVLTLLYLDERSVAEASALIGWSQTMVKVQAHRARKKLKRLCEENFA